ncbi:MAG: acetyl-CoA carboxylase biotin carboxyl carrier protein [Culicoidibacterales bacterium]
MDIKNVEALIALLEKSNLTVLEIQDGDAKIRIEKQKETIIQGYSNTVAGLPGTNSIKETQEEESGTKIVSPLVGNFYAQSAPGEKALVAVGQAVSVGEVICIVEAMKVMNEITATVSGKIKSIAVNNGDVVEFGQTLFVIE